MRSIHNILKILFSVLVIAVISSSCEKYIDFEGENMPRRLVLNGLVQADSVFRVDLSHSLGYIDIGALSSVENGTVEVYLSDGLLLETLVHTEDGTYEGNQVAMAGQSYRVEARAPGMQDVWAADLVPQPVAISDWDTITTTTDEFFGSSALNISFTITDPTGDNYYAIEVFETRLYEVEVIGFDPQTGQAIYDTTYYDNPERYVLGLSTNDVVLASEYTTSLGDGMIYDDRFQFSDELFKSTTRTFNINLDYFSRASDIEIKLSSCSPDLYQYYRTRQRYNNTVGDPFAEPVQVFTNVESGLGIWGGQSAYSVVVEF